MAHFFFALVGTVLLLLKSHSPDEVFSNCTYGFSLILLFGVSALYHRPQWGQRGYAIMRRLDHAAIFILIAGTATPICILGLGGKDGTTLLITVWITALLGILQSFFWTKGPKWIRALPYVIAGWVITPYFKEFVQLLGETSAEWILIGGLIYTLGTVVYAMKRPNPFPRVFGYHEIFHIMVIVAASFHFAVNYHFVDR